MSAPAEQARIEALVADLGQVAAFADQHQDDLEWFVSQSRELRTPVGEITVKEGSPAEAMFVILEGELRARREMGPAGSPVYTAHAGDVTGVLPFSRMKTYSVTVRAVLPMRSEERRVGKGCRCGGAGDQCTEEEEVGVDKGV